jgi:WD40 repeat protein
MHDLLQQDIKGYKLTQLIGSGGFGAVYRAHQASVDREVAVKVILPEHANNPKFIRNFDAEAHLIARLEHPYVVPLFDYWREPDGAYLVMRYYTGGSLAQRVLNEGVIPIEDAARILDQIASALDAAHRNNILHRDIKPANIMLDKENNAYLGDFGLAKNVTEISDENRFVGSPAYVSPEVIMKHDLDARADIYSLGFVLYEMLTGRYAYIDATLSSAIHSVLDFHLYEPIPEIEFQSEAVNMVLQRATAKDPEDRYPTAGAFAQAFRAALKHTVESHLLPADIPNPYKGLHAFEEADAGTFFGREELVRRLLARMEEDVEGYNFLALVGPSGSGKSSAVYAGLLPALRNGYISGSDSWFIVTMMPGAEPIKQLAAALRSVAVKPVENLEECLRQSTDGLCNLLPKVLPSPDNTLLLVIDHFEELFTQTTDTQERRQFLELVREGLKADNLRVITLLRADFYDRPMMYEGFGSLIQSRTEVVLPLNSMELHNVIINPAKIVGLEVQPELTAAMVADVRDEAAALPLLQYALTEMFERNDKSALTLETYQAIGGVAGALAHRADEIYATLIPPEQQAARQILMRLVTLGEGTEDTRRRARRSELLSVIGNNNRILQSVLDTFGNYRLLTFDNDEETREPTVEVAHEALIREWKQLREWLDSSRNDIRQQRALYRAALEWQQAGHDASYLLRGSHLVQLTEWAKTTRINLNDLEQRYLLASNNEMLHEQEIETKRQQHELQLEQQSRQRLRYLVYVLAGAAVVALMLTGFAFRQMTVAQDAEQRAREAANEVSTQVAIAENNAHEAAVQAAEARSLALAASAQEAALLDETDTALALAMEAVDVTDSVISAPPQLAIDTLLDVSHAPGLIYEQQAFQRPLEHIAVSLDGNLALLSVGRNQTSYWEFGQPPIGGGSPSGQLPPPPRPEDFALVVWDIAARTATVSLAGHQTEATDLLFLPPTEDELYRPVSASSDGTVIFWNLASGQPHYELTAFNPGFITLSTTANGELLLAASGANVRQQRPGEMVLVDAQTGSIVQRIAEQHPNLAMARITPDGQYIVALYLDGTHIVWDLENETQKSTFTIPAGSIRHASLDMLISPDSRTVATNTGGIDVILWDLETGDEVGVARARTTLSHRIDFSADGDFLLMMSRDAFISLWNMPGNYLDDSLGIGGDATISVALAPDSETALIGTRDGMLRVYAVAAQPLGLQHKYGGEGNSLGGTVFTNEEGTFLISAHTDSDLRSGYRVVLWDVATGERIAQVTRITRRLSNDFELHVSPDGRYIMGISELGLQLWELTSGLLQSCIFCQENAQRSEAAFIPTSGQNGIPLQALVEDENQLYWWNIDERDTRLILENIIGEITQVRVSSDGQTALVIITPPNANVQPPQGQQPAPTPVPENLPAAIYTLLWLNIETGTVNYRVELDSEPMQAVFMPDSLNAAVAIRITDNQSVNNDTVADSEIVIAVINPLTGAIEPRFIGHENEIRSIRFSSDGMRMVTGSLDRNAIIWDVATGTILHTITTVSVVQDAMFTPDDSSIVTIVQDETPALWHSEPFILEEGIAWAMDNRAIRALTDSECRRYQMEAFCN